MSMKKKQTIPGKIVAYPFLKTGIIMLLLLLCNSVQQVHGQVDRYSGLRPYELDWAGRYDDDHVPLVDFEEAEEWTALSSDGTASIERSNQEIIWDDYCYKLTYQANSLEADFIVRPPGPVEIREAFTALNLWVFGNYRIWNTSDRTRPIAKLSILLETKTGETFDIPFCRHLDHGRWYLLHIRLNKEQREAFADGGLFKGFR